jgi:alpha/beta superfamily hydrolase
MTTAVVVLHPHPSMGGDSSHPFVVTVAGLLRGLGYEVVTPDLVDPDVAAAARELEQIADGIEADRLFFVGYSWGSVVTSHAQPARLAARVLVAPPGLMPLGDVSSLPTLALIPENDQYGGALLPASVTSEVIARADHFLWGFVDDIARRAVEWLSER